MSFSFRRTADSKDAIKAAIKEEMDGIAKHQPIHTSDAEQVVAVASAYVDILDDLEEGDEIIITVSGSLGWHGDQSNKEIVSANVGVNAALHKK